VSQNYVYDSLTTNTKLIARVPGTIKLSNDEIKNSAPIEMMYTLVHASRSIQNVDMSSGSYSSLYYLLSSHYVIDDSTDYCVSKLENDLNLLSISNIEKNYATISKDSVFVQQFDTESSDLNKISSYNIALAATNLNTQDALRNAKQDR
jgi:hypothetical protein